jgi:hypothetical protein
MMKRPLLELGSTGEARVHLSKLGPLSNVGSNPLSKLGPLSNVGSNPKSKLGSSVECRVHSSVEVRATALSKVELSVGVRIHCLSYCPLSKLGPLSKLDSTVEDCRQLSTFKFRCQQ